MSHQQPVTEASAGAGATEARRTHAIQMMVLGAVVAVLGPLGGFLAGSMIGPGSGLGDFDAMYVALFAGLVLGGAGAVLAGLGLLGFARRQARADGDSAPSLR